MSCSSEGVVRRWTEWQGLGERVTLTQGQVRLWNIPRFNRFFSVVFLGGGIISQRLFNSAFCNAQASLKCLLMRSSLSRKRLTMQWYSNDRARMISLSQISESTFIIQCDKLTRKMSVKCYTYMNFCVRSPSVHLFFSESIAEGFFVPGSSALCFQAFKQIALRPSEFAD